MKPLLVALAALLTLPLSGSAPAQAGHGRDAAGLELIGYRIIVDPEIREGDRGGLRTRALNWQIRAVYVTPRGDEVLASPRPPQGRMSVRDSSVRVNRAWEWSDFSRESRVFSNYKKALRRFDGLKNSPDITLLGGEAVPDPRVVIEPVPPLVVVTPTPIPVPVVVPRGPTCRAVLLDKGYHPSQLDNCDGVDERCAVALLRAGHHPSNLDNCRPGLSPRCVQTLLAKGHHPMHLDNCRGVDDVCAVKLLKAGNHPMHLSNCK